VSVLTSKHFSVLISRDGRRHSRREGGKRERERERQEQRDRTRDKIMKQNYVYNTGTTMVILFRKQGCILGNMIYSGPSFWNKIPELMQNS